MHNQIDSNKLNQIVSTLKRRIVKRFLTYESDILLYSGSKHDNN